MEKFGKWLDNFWYYHKHQVLIGAFFVIFFTICIFQFVGNESVDAYLMVAGPKAIGGEEIEKMQSALSQIMPDDYTGDGKKNARVVSICLMTDRQIAEAAAEAKKQGIDDFYIDMQYMSDARQQFDLQFLAGDCYLCLLDPALYAEMKTQGAFEKIEDPRSEDGFGLLFWNTDFASFFSETFEKIPPDTVFCLRKVPATSLGKRKEKEKQAFHAALFDAILAFETSETD